MCRKRDDTGGEKKVYKIQLMVKNKNVIICTFMRNHCTRITRVFNIVFLNRHFTLDHEIVKNKLAQSL